MRGFHTISPDILLDPYNIGAFNLQAQEISQGPWNDLNLFSHDEILGEWKQIFQFINGCQLQILFTVPLMWVAILNIPSQSIRLLLKNEPLMAIRAYKSTYINSIRRYGRGN
jgi:hypothetical protein